MIRSTTLLALLASCPAAAQDLNPRERTQTRVQAEATALRQVQSTRRGSIAERRTAAAREVDALSRQRSALDADYDARIRRARSRSEANAITADYEREGAQLDSQIGHQVGLLADLDIEHTALDDAERAQRRAQDAREDWLDAHGVGAVDGVTSSFIPLFEPREGSDAHERFFEITFHPVDGERIFLDAVAEPQTLTPRLFDACDPSRYFVHLPARDFETGFSARQLKRIQDRLRNRTESWWFADDDSTRDTVPIRRSAAPHVVAALRDAVAPELSGSSKGARIGRVCAFANQVSCDPDDAPYPYVAQAPWHLDRLGFAAELPQAQIGAVHVALLDSGIDTRIVRGTEHHRGVSDQAAAGADKVHGTYMGLLIRQVLPTAAIQLHSYRVFDDTNTGNHHWLATALAQAIFGGEHPDSEPLVVNLSLGWPPELGQQRELSVTGDGRPGPIGHVETFEDGIGEAVRAVLDDARVADQAGHRKISVLAAAGNRPKQGDVGPALRTDYGMTQRYSDSCLGKADRSFQWFFPAEWDSTPTCELGPEEADGTQDVLDKRYLTWAVSATDPADSPSVVAIAEDNLEPLFVAPGEQVLITSDAEPRIEIDLPAVVSGTSVSTALASAVAAYAQSLCVGREVDGCQDGLSRYQLGQLLNYASRPLNRSSYQSASAPMRVPDMCRVHAALRCDANVLGCIGTIPPDAQSRIHARHTPCADRDDMMADVFDACTRECEGPVLESTAPRMTDEYIEWLECTLEAPVLADDAEVCDGLCSAHTTIVDGLRQAVPSHASMGTVGPQPTFPECITCGVEIHEKLGSLDAWVKLSGNLPYGTTLEAASIEIIHKSGPSDVFTVPYDEVKTWTVGDSFWVQGSKKWSSGTNWGTSKAVFRGRLKAWFGFEYDKVAVIPLNVKP